MIGRASIGNPWFFNQVKSFLQTGEKIEPPSVLERINVAKRHLEMSVKWKGDRLGILETRRHYSNYFKGIKDFKPYRTKLVTLETKDELMSLFSELEQIKESLFVTV
tara:strand:- start:2975 stop:3295 length:321 start_codon:yes stop_codon:yes gene_type:complete